MGVYVRVHEEDVSSTSLFSVSHHYRPKGTIGILFAGAVGASLIALLLLLLLLLLNNDKVMEKESVG